MQHFSKRMNQEQMRECARALARELRQGDAVLLSGEVGAGKTTFSRELIHALAPHIGEVTSPTFSLVQPYDVVIGGKKTELWHCDLYRLEHPSQLAELGILEPHPARTLLIEWPELVMGELGDEALAIRFALPDNAPASQERDIRAEGSGRWTQWIETIGKQ